MAGHVGEFKRLSKNDAQVLFTGETWHSILVLDDGGDIYIAHTKYTSTSNCTCHTHKHTHKYSQPHAPHTGIYDPLECGRTPDSEFLTPSVRCKYEQLTGRKFETVVQADFLEGPCQAPGTQDCVFYVLSAMSVLGPNSDREALASLQVDRGTLRQWIVDLIDSYDSVNKVLDFDYIEPDIDESQLASPAAAAESQLASPAAAAAAAAAAAVAAVSGSGTNVKAKSGGKAKSGDSILFKDIRSFIARRVKSSSIKNSIVLIEKDSRAPSSTLEFRFGCTDYIEIDGEDLVDIDPVEGESDLSYPKYHGIFTVLKFPPELLASLELLNSDELSNEWCGLLAPSLLPTEERDGYLLRILRNLPEMPMPITTTAGDRLFMFVCKDLSEARTLHATAMQETCKEMIPNRPDFELNLEGGGLYWEGKRVEDATKSWKRFWSNHRQLGCSIVGPSGTRTTTVTDTST